MRRTIARRARGLHALSLLGLLGCGAGIPGRHGAAGPEPVPTGVVARGPAEIYRDLFDARVAASAALYVPSFAARVPPWQIDQLVAELRTRLGPFRGVEAQGEQYLLRFERGTLPSRMRLHPDGRIDLLWFGAPLAGPAPTLESSLAAFAALSGRRSLWIAENGRPRAAVDADRVLAVGSTFKLALLAALDGEVIAGRRRWDEVVTLRPEWRSLPSGLLQDWPDGAPVTLHTLATLMVSHSDNTAADAVLALVGRAALERAWPRNRPFLATREAFALTALPNAALLERYVAASPGARAELLREAAALGLPGPADLETHRARAPDAVGWWFSTRELCGLMARVQALAPMRAPSTAPRPDGWDRVAYKGGRAPGLHQQTYWLQRGPREVCLSASWNGPDDGGLEQFDRAVLRLLEALAASAPAS